MHVLNRQGLNSNIPKTMIRSNNVFVQPPPPHAVMALQTPIRNSLQKISQISNKKITGYNQFEKQISPQKFQRRVNFVPTNYITPVRKFSYEEKSFQALPPQQVQKDKIYFQRPLSIQKKQNSINIPTINKNSPIITLKNMLNKEVLNSQYYQSQFAQNVANNNSQNKVSQLVGPYKDVKNAQQKPKGIEIFVPNKKFLKLNNSRTSKNHLKVSLKQDPQPIRAKKKIFTASKNKIKPDYSVNRRKIFCEDSKLIGQNKKSKYSQVSLVNSGTIQSFNSRINEKLNNIKIYNYGIIDRMDMSNSKTTKSYGKNQSKQNAKSKGIKYSYNNEIKNNEFDISSIIQKLQDKSRYYDLDEQSEDKSQKEYENLNENQFKDYLKKKRQEDNNHQPTNISSIQQKINDLDLIGRRTSMDKQFFDLFSPRNFSQLPNAASHRKIQEDNQISKHIVQPILNSPNETLQIFQDMKKTTSKKLDASLMKSAPSTNPQIGQSKLFHPLIAIVSLALFILLSTVIK